MTSDPSPQLFLEYPCVETIAYYRIGGFHPIHINDVLQDRYRIVNKLGYGTYGTVWLVEDLKSGKCAALKVLAAEISKDVSEVDILRYIRQQQLKKEGSSGQEFVIDFLDDFKVEGPNGTHQCIVTEVLGPGLKADLDELYDEGWFPIEIVKTIITQVARGVEYLHSCGVVHGDLHAGNILFRIPGVDQMSYQDLAVYLGEPYERPLTRQDKQPVISTPHQPKYVVPASEMLDLLPLCLNSQDSIQLKICDYGEAFLCGDKPQKIKLNTPAVYAAPEITFRDYVSPATDVWALAILIRILLRGGPPFYFSHHEMKKRVLREMVATLGKLPDKWWTKWEDRSEYFDENEMFIMDEKISPAVSRNFLTIPSDRMDEEELNELEIIVRKMVFYELTDRISATEVVRSLSEMWTKSRHQRV